MEEKMRERIALKRFELISPVLAEPGRVQNEYFRKQAGIKHEFPGSGTRGVAVSTLKSWLRKYRKKGLEGLKPKKRSDGGRPRRMSEEMMKIVEVKCKAYPYWTVQKLYEHLVVQQLLGQPPVHYNTLLRVVKLQGWLAPRGRTDVRKSYEVEHANDLWIADFMHGPVVRTGNGRTAKAILCAVIDDHSRLIVGHGFSATETVSSLTVVLKEAFSAYGIPRRLYVDNGPSFSSELLARSCAVAGISLIHSKPYDSPSRGKVERFFRTVRDRFLAGLQETVSLTEINQAFWAWLQEEYHHRVHAGIGEKPIDRYNGSLEHAQIRRLSKAELDEAFLVRHTRVVGNDATISFQGALYEVPAAYIRQKIEIRHPVDAPEELYLYDSGVRVGRVRLLDKKENARTFRPQRLPTQLSFANKRTLS
jgi:transposase InsO family protein